MQAQGQDERTDVARAAVRSQNASGRDVQAGPARQHEAARSAAVRQLISRSVLHGPALRSLLAARR